MKRNTLRKNIKNAFMLIFIAVLATMVGFYLQRKENFVNEYVDVTYETVNTEKIYTASMVMVGDALMHMPINRNYKTSNGYDFKGIFKYIKPIIETYDLAYYNQETMLGGSSLGLSGYPQFNSPTEVGEAFVDAGFNLVSLATNHTLDGRYRYSDKAITNSRKFWNSQEGVIAAGSYTSNEERDEVIIKEVNGIKYALLSYTTSTNGITVPKGKEYLVNVYSQSKVKADIEKYRDQVDLLMVAMHWGVEYVHYPVQEQKTIAKYLASLDVDIIIGCHPHVIQPIDIIDDTLVIYSLGNFVSNQDTVAKLTGLMASVTIKKRDYHGKTTISFEDITGDLIYTNKKNKHVVYPYSELTNNILSNYKSQYEKFSKYVTAYSDKVKMKGL